MSGDLAKFVPVSPWYEFLAFSAATISEYQTGLTEVDLFAESVAPSVALVGTSYSATEAHSTWPRTAAQPSSVSGVTPPKL